MPLSICSIRQNEKPTGDATLDIAKTPDGKMVAWLVFIGVASPIVPETCLVVNAIDILSIVVYKSLLVE